MGVQRHLIQDEELGEVVAYTSADAAALLGTSSKTVIARAKPTSGGRAELRGWKPNSEANPSRAWMVDAQQVDALAGSDMSHLQSEVLRLREELDAAVGRADADRELVERERATLEDRSATVAMERAEYQQATVDAAVSRAVVLEKERDQARAAVRALGQTVQELTERLAGIDL